MKKRYFITSYRTNLGYGMVDSMTEGNFLNKRLFIKEIKEEQAVQWVIVTNIIELNEADFLNWIA